MLKHNLHLQNYILCLAAKLSSNYWLAKDRPTLALPRFAAPGIFRKSSSHGVNLFVNKHGIHISTSPYPGGILDLRGFLSKMSSMLSFKLKVGVAKMLNKNLPSQRRPATSESSCSKRKITRSFFSWRVRSFVDDETQNSRTAEWGGFWKNNIYNEFINTSGCISVTPPPIPLHNSQKTCPPIK